MARGSTPSANAALAASPAAKPEDPGPGFDAGRGRGSRPALPTVDPYGDLVRDLPTFKFEGEEEEAFNAWYARYDLIIDDRGKALTVDRKRNLIVEKLDKATYKTYSEHVLPLKPQEIDLANTISNLRKLFGPKKTLICRRYEFLQSKCLPLIGAYLPYREYGNMIKRKFEDASMKDVDSDSSKCLFFLSGLTDPFSFQNAPTTSESVELTEGI
ncbi:hypothetical protein ANCCAN_24032 [Ancylostoma caninum]|uniref:DUF7083 domain-containing protein n=1 Tax=Ancylostoma caninum TaxID=29170 RepID=A0A368FHB5_ANCCA|nr:hypothetical protein ANCCAN_24032 [Ancylostoma caninum]